MSCGFGQRCSLCSLLVGLAFSGWFGPTLQALQLGPLGVWYLVMFQFFYIVILLMVVAGSFLVADCVDPHSWLWSA